MMVKCHGSDAGLSHAVFTRDPCCSVLDHMERIERRDRRGARQATELRGFSHGLCRFSGGGSGMGTLRNVSGPDVDWRSWITGVPGLLLWQRWRAIAWGEVTR